MKIVRHLLCWLLTQPAMAQLPGDLLRIYDHDMPVGEQAGGGTTIVLDIIQDRKGYVWFATSKGLIRYDGVRYDHFYHRQDQPRSIGGNQVRALLETPDGTLFLALADGGMSRYDRYTPDTQSFTNYPHHPYRDNSPSTNALHTIARDSAGILWMGGENSGLIRFDPRTSRFTTHRHQPGNPHSLPDNTLFRICPDPDGTLWMGTRQHGLVRFDPRREQFTAYPLGDLIPASYESENGVGPICVGKDARTVWFASQALGLCALDKRTGRIRVHGVGDVIHRKSELTHLLHIAEAPDGVLWLGHTHQGTLLYDPLTGLVKRLPLTSQPGTNLEVRRIYFDRTGLAWLATNRGVIQYNPATHGATPGPPGEGKAADQSALFARYPVRDGAGRPVPGLAGVQQDRRGDFWLQFPNRLCRYDTTRRCITASYAYPAALLRAGLKHIQVVGEQVFLLSFKGLFVLRSPSSPIIPLPSLPTAKPTPGASAAPIRRVRVPTMISRSQRSLTIPPSAARSSTGLVREGSIRS